VQARLYAVVLLPMLLFFIISYTLFHFYVHNLIAEDFSHHLQHILSLEKNYLETWLDERLQDIVLLSDALKHIYGDIDETDTYGHNFGVKVLKEMGSTIKNSIRESDLPARYGGEEFVILAYKADERQAEQLAERLRREVAAQSHLYEKSPEGDNDRKVQTEEVKITISVGVALLNEDLSDGLQSKKSVKESLEKLLSQADEALYRAKENVRNRVERRRGKERPDTQE
jgi:diguanylate cyclase (GGDEF)-like protein